MTIRKIIKQGQALMCDLEVQRLVNIVHDLDKQLDEDGRRIAFLTGAARDYCWPSYPQSLGEFLIEHLQERLRKDEAGPRKWFIVGGKPVLGFESVPAELFRALRLAMYHKKEKT